MVATLSTIFYLLLFFGLYKLIFKRSGFGCLFIIVSLILFNIFVPDGYDTKAKKEKTKRETVNDSSHVNSIGNFPNNVNSDITNDSNNPVQSVESNSYSNEHESSYDRNYDNKNYDPYYGDDYNDDYDDDYGDKSTRTYYRNSEQQNDTYPSIIEQNDKVRVGAICNDGTISNSTDRGTCSHHGGVAEWLYE